MPARFKIRRAPGFPRPYGVHLLILALSHLDRVGFQGINRFRQDAAFRLELRTLFGLIKNLVQLSINAKRCRVGACM